MEEPYIIKKVITEVAYWNPKYDQSAECKCGHKYYRHFDSYEGMFSAGCKYCDCFRFEPV